MRRHDGCPKQLLGCVTWVTEAEVHEAVRQGADAGDCGARDGSVPSRSCMTWIEILHGGCSVDSRVHRSAKPSAAQWWGRPGPVGGGQGEESSSPVVDTLRIKSERIHAVFAYADIDTSPDRATSRRSR